MQIGVNTLLWTAGFSEAHLPLIAKAKALGLDGIELATFDFASFPAAAARRELEAQQMPGILCSALVAGMSLVTDDAALRAQSMAFLQAGVRATAEAGLSLFIGPFCSAVGYLPGRRRTDEEWKRCVDGLQELGRYSEGFNVRVAVEPLNRFETFFLNTAADAKRLCEEVAHPNIGVLYDTFHANIEEKNFAEAIRAGGNCINHVHISANDRATPGDDHIDYDTCFAALKEIGYDGWMVIEAFGSWIPDLAGATCIWRVMAPSEEYLATNGLKMIREKWGA